MIQINGIAHVGLRVSAFPRAVAFFQQLGFETVREDYRERVVVLRHGSGVEINLLDSAVARPHNILMDEPSKYPGYTHLALFVANLNSACRALDALGIAISEGPVTFGDGKRSIFFRDPDLNVIELTTEEGAPCS